MTTDITELAQREKFEAWAEEVGALPWGILKKHRNQDGSYPGPHYTYMWKAWQAASAELVEALELKEEQRANWFQMAQKLGEDLDATEKRIAELESRTVRLPDDEDGQACGFGKWSNSKLPATAGTMTIAYCEDAWRAAFEVFSSAAGIKVEAE